MAKPMIFALRPVKSKYSANFNGCIKDNFWLKMNQLFLVLLKT